MKKIAAIIALIIVTVALGATLVACNNATTQGQLVDAWKEGRPYERYTYSVDDSATEGKDGTYVSEIIYHSAYNTSVDESDPAYSDRVTVGDTSIEQREGYLIRGTLSATLYGSEVEYVTECYFALTDGSNYLLPVATFRSETVDGTETLRMNGVYNGSSLSYTLVVNGGEAKTGTVGLGSPYYDNNEFHQSLRGVSTFFSSFSFGFSTAIVNATEQTSASLTFSVSGTATVGELEFASYGRDENGNEVQNGKTAVECYRATLSRSTTVSGSSQTLWYSVNPIYAAVTDDGTATELSTYDNGWWALPHVLVGFSEPYKTATSTGTVTYALTGISLIAPAAEA